MSAAVTTLSASSASAGPLEVTLLELVTAVSDVADNEREVVATVFHMLRNGSVQLCGNFRGSRPDDFA